MNHDCKGVCGIPATGVKWGLLGLLGLEVKAELAEEVFVN